MPSVRPEHKGRIRLYHLQDYRIWRALFSPPKLRCLSYCTVLTRLELCPRDRFGKRIKIRPRRSLTPFAIKDITDGHVTAQAIRHHFNVLCAWRRDWMHNLGLRVRLISTYTFMSRENHVRTVSLQDSEKLYPVWLSSLFTAASKANCSESDVEWLVTEFPF